MPDFTINRCKTKKGFSVKPKSNIKLNLKSISKKFKTTLDADVLLVIDNEGEIIVHGYGELIFKELDDKDKIKSIAEEIYRAGGVDD
ncbi:hypothetical protein ACFL3V_02275 [Nanoarchaeota archaeon]